MKIGFISHELSERILGFAVESGFVAIEWAGFAHGTETAGVEALVHRYREERGLDLVALGTAVNPLHPDPAQREQARGYLDELVALCPRLGARYISNVSGWDPGQDLAANLRLLAEYYRPLAGRARAHGVGIVFENCPHGYPFPGGQNLAVTPELWRQVFEAIGEDNVGLEFDPSHLAWQGIDCVAACRESLPWIRLVHAKDTEVRRERLAAVGIYGADWWRYRLPGYGEVDFPRLIQVLHEAGYDGPVLIEHEDPFFEGDRRYEGLLAGKRYLDRLLVP